MFIYVLTILLIILMLVLVNSYCNHKLNYWRRRGIQQLCSTNKLFGDFMNGVLFRTSPGYHLGNIYREAPKQAPYAGFYIFHKPCLLLRDPEIIKQILIRDFDNFPNRHFAGSQQRDSIGMLNLFGLKDPAWRYLRKRITPTLTQSKLRSLVALMLGTGEPMMSYLKRRVGETGIVDAQEVSNRYTADFIANFGFGTTTDSFNYPDADYTKCLMRFFHSFKRMVALVTVFFMPELVEAVGPSMLFDTSFVRNMFWAAVESRERSGQKRGDYIDSIIQLKNGEQNPLYKLEGDNLLYQSGAFFTGLESSSTVSSFTLMELAKHKEAQARAREDITSAIQQYGWTNEAFNAMKYLDQCIAEGIRLHPPISTIDRQTLKDYKIPNTDIIIEEGTPIYISLYGLQGDPNFFEDPDTFNPDRFNDGIVSDAYIPFGAGQRRCIGEKIGKMHVKVVISLILSEYEVYQNTAQENQLDPRSTFTAAAAGIPLHFTKLNQC